MVLKDLKPNEYFSFSPSGLILKCLEIDNKAVKYCSSTKKVKEKTCKNSDWKLPVFLRSPLF